METTELLKKVRQIEIKTRGLSNNIFAGQYHSAFKGRGMAFSEVREYQFGDDIRDIDWNVTARFHKPFVKVFEEERELTVMLLVDVSGSLEFGTVKQMKPAVEPVTKKPDVSAVVKESAAVAAPVSQPKKQPGIAYVPDSTNYTIVGTETTYTIKPGETLTRVALRFYGTKALYPYIVKHNPGVIKKPDNVPAGTTIKIPKLAKKQ